MQTTRTLRPSALALAAIFSLGFAQAQVNGHSSGPDVLIGSTAPGFHSPGGDPGIGLPAVYGGMIFSPALVTQGQAINSFQLNHMPPSHLSGVNPGEKVSAGHLNHSLYFGEYIDSTAGVADSRHTVFYVGIGCHYQPAHQQRQLPGHRYQQLRQRQPAQQHVGRHVERQLWRHQPADRQTQPHTD